MKRLATPPVSASFARMRALHIAVAAPFLLAASAPSPVERRLDPLLFFVGRTETVGTVKVIFKKPYRSRCLGQGRIEPDGSLTLVQRVEDEGHAPRERRWRVRELGPRRYIGTMSEASGPLEIQQVGDRFRFRFAMKGSLSVEQWLIPMPGATSARSISRVRKFGMTVATSEGTVRKLAGG
jgi:hypothetical protein